MHVPVKNHIEMFDLNVCGGGGGGGKGFIFCTFTNEYSFQKWLGRVWHDGDSQTVQLLTWQEWVLIYVYTEFVEFK